MAKGKLKPKAKKPAGKTADSYLHPADTVPMRPEIGTQANFRKKKPPKTYRYDSSLSPSLDTHPIVEAFVKNAGLGFAIPYLHNGQPHDYVPDFIVRLKTAPATSLIIETKGFDELAEVKAAASQRWVTAVNADGRFGRWHYEMARQVPRVRAILDAFA